MEESRSQIFEFVKNARIIIKQRDRTKKPANARIIAVTSGKGGVGKSSLTGNLAVKLADNNKKVLLVDADMGLANLDIIFGVTPRYTIEHVLAGHRCFRDILTPVYRNVDLISGVSGVFEMTELSQELKNEIIDGIASLEENYDIILIDTGAGISNNVISFLNASDDIIVVTTPEPTALADAYSIMKTLNVFNLKRRVKLVVNRIIDIMEATDVVNRLSNVARQFLKIDLKSLGYIYDDIEMTKSIRRQLPVVLAFPDSLASRCISMMAEKLIDENIYFNIPKTNSSFIRRIASIVGL